MNYETPAIARPAYLLRRVHLRRLHALAILLVTALLAGMIGYLIHRHIVSIAPAVPASGQSVTRLPARTFGHWNLVCVRDAQAVTRCDVVLRVVDQTSKKLVLSLVLGRNPEHRAIFVVVTPPNAVAADGVRMTPAGAATHSIAIAACVAGSCRAALPVTDALTAELAAANAINVRYNNKEGREVQYDLPNDGFADALAAWRANSAN